MATLDPPLDVLRSQILAATTLTKSEIGWIAGAGHRQSGPHFPENPPPAGNPPSEVDAIDVPHAPAKKADMAVLTEALRQSRDPRIKLVIFNRRIFSSYAHAEGPPYTWRPYREKDPHTGHAHIERTDSLRGDLRPWQIGIDMFDAEAKRQLAHLYALVTTGGDSSCGPVVPDKDRLPGTIAGVGGEQVARWGNSLPEQLNSIRRMAAEALTGNTGQTDIDALADALAERLPARDVEALANALAERLNIRFTGH